MEKTKQEKYKLGLFVLFGTALLLGAVYLIGSGKNMFGKTIIVHAIFNNVSGLKQDDMVRCSGIDVGTVKGIEMINDTTINIDLQINGNMRRHIRTNAVATIGSDGIVGSMMVNIAPGKGNARNIRSGDTIKSNTTASMSAMINTLSDAEDNTADLTKNLAKVSESLEKGQGTFGSLLKDSVMAKDLQKTFANLKSISDEANVTIKGLNSIVRQMNLDNSVGGVLLTDSIEGQRIKGIIDKLENVSNNLDNVTTDISEGQGAINYLATDTVLVDQIKDMMKSADQGIQRFDDNMEALEHNFLFRGYFKKQRKKREKAAKKEKDK